MRHHVTRGDAMKQASAPLPVGRQLSCPLGVSPSQCFIEPTEPESNDGAKTIG
jgi:hypothetical protein